MASRQWLTQSPRRATLIVMRAIISPTLVLAGSITATACTPRPASAPAPRVAGKHELFGDPSLVPTREGEHLRREVALAGEIERGMITDPSVVACTVSVRLEANSRAGRGDQVAIRIKADSEGSALHQALEESAERLAHSVVPTAEVDVLVHEGAPAPRPALAWPLALVLLGLGCSCGVAAERWRSRFRATS